MAFNISELTFRDDSFEEQVRTRQIFETLRDRASRKQKLTEHEKEFFYEGLRLTRVKNDGSPDNYECCDNPKFKFFYVVYFENLKGSGIYKKPIRTFLYHVKKKEIQSDLQYLYKKADEWEKVVAIGNHPEELLQQLCAETREEIKELKKLPENQKIRSAKERFDYLTKLRSLLLRSKYIYCLALEIFELLKPQDFILTINAQTIEFTEYSLIHILNRHYAQIAKQTRSNKSFHGTSVFYKYLSIYLKNVLFEIDQSGYLNGKQIDKIAFKVHGLDYEVYTAIKTKSVRG